MVEAMRLRDRTFATVAGAPLVMGIVNASPESFSDGGAYATLDAQVDRALELVAAGADLIDVGGESGVTGVDPLHAIEEARRVVPLVERLVAAGVVVSVDTWKAPVAEAVLAAGAHMVNDVSGLADPTLADLCARHEAGLVVMHTRAQPKHKDFPRYDDVVADVIVFLAERAALAITRGLDRSSIVVDPGPDFAKTPAQTIEVLRRLPDIATLGYPVLLAVSRKDFIGALTRRSPRRRGAGTLAAVAEGVDAGATFVRVHDVVETVEFLAVRAALRGEREVAADLFLPIELRKEPTAAQRRE
jgi:dihydropteroate synthase